MPKTQIKEDLTMAMRIQNNIAALNAQNSLEVSQSAMQKSLARLSSGYRINSAKDDAAGLAISQGFRANIASVKVAQRNITEANSLLQVAEGAMSSVGDILTRMKELATQAASANVGTDISKVASEYDTLVSEIDRIADSTKYAGTQLLKGTFSAGQTGAFGGLVGNTTDLNVLNAVRTGAWTASDAGGGGDLTLTSADGTLSQTVTIADGAQTVNFDVLGISFKTTAAANGVAVAAAIETASTLTVTAGATAAFQVGYGNTTSQDQLAVTLSSMNSDDLKTAGAGLASGDIATSALAFTAMTNIDDAISTLSKNRAAVGAYQNRLGYASANLSATLENFTAAESSIRDVDMAAEMTSFTKNQILVQAGTAMLAQANSAPQQILSLLKG
jgi:flagellin